MTNLFNPIDQTQRQVNDHKLGLVLIQLINLLQFDKNYLIQSKQNDFLVAALTSLLKNNRKFVINNLPLIPLLSCITNMISVNDSSKTKNVVFKSFIVQGEMKLHTLILNGFALY